MAERDAFGNEIGGTSDPLTTDFGAAASRTPRVPRTPRGPGAIRAVVTGAIALVAVALGIALVVLSDSSKVADPGRALRHSISTQIARITVPTLPEAPAPPKTPPTGLGSGSLLVRANFANALDILRPEGSHLRSLRVAPDRIDASIVTTDGYMKQVQVTYDGRLQRFSRVGPGFPLTGSFTVDGLVRAAPFRLARAATARAGRTPAAVDYLVAISLGTEQGWTIILKGGGQYLADHRGRIRRRLS